LIMSLARWAGVAGRTAVSRQRLTPSRRHRARGHRCTRSFGMRCRSRVSGAPTHTHSELTPQRLDCLAEDAVKSETVSPAGSPCNLRFAGRFSEIAGRADLFPVKFLNSFRTLGGVLPTQGAGSIFWYCREEQRGIANGSRVGADSASDRCRPRSSHHKSSQASSTGTAPTGLTNRRLLARCPGPGASRSGASGCAVIDVPTPAAALGIGTARRVGKLAMEAGTGARTCLRAWQARRSQPGRGPIRRPSCEPLAIAISRVSRRDGVIGGVVRGQHG
jgi:hypothetical protein